MSKKSGRQSKGKDCGSFTHTFFSNYKVYAFCRVQIYSRSSSSVEAPISRDPCLPTQDRPLGYVDIFVDNFMTLAHGKLNQKQVRKILMQAVDQVIRPLQASDPSTR